MTPDCIMVSGIFAPQISASQHVDRHKSVLLGPSVRSQQSQSQKSGKKSCKAIRECPLGHNAHHTYPAMHKHAQVFFTVTRQSSQMGSRNQPSTKRSTSFKLPSGSGNCTKPKERLTSFHPTAPFGNLCHGACHRFPEGSLQQLLLSTSPLLTTVAS